MPRTTSTAVATATAGASGGWIVLEWAWNGYMVPSGHPQMPEAVAVALAGLIAGLIGLAIRGRPR